MLVTLTLLLGLWGWLGTGTAWLLVALLALGLLDFYFDQARWRSHSAPAAATALAGGLRPNLSWLWLLTAVPLGVAIAGATLPPGILWGDEPHGYDVLSYHLQVPREWYEAGRILPLDHNVFSHFPLAQETLSLLLMHQMGGPWHAMYGTQIVSLLLMVLTTVAVVGGVAQAASDTDGDWQGAPMVAGIIFATLPWTAMLGSIAYNEALLLLASALACAWILRAVRGDWRSSLPAGLFIGLGVAAKYPAAPMLALPGGAALLVTLPWRGKGKQSALALLALVGGTLVFSGPWLLRNLSWTGNPVFPLATDLFGDGGWDPALVDRWNRAHSLAVDETRSGRIFEDLLLNPRYAYIFWPALVTAAAMLIARRERRGMLLAVWLGAMVATWVFATHLQGRFLVVAVPLGAILIGLAVAPRLRRVGAGVAVLLALAGLAWLLPTARQRTSLARSAELSLFGFRDLAQLTVIEDPARIKDADLYLVGDARAFLYTVPTLHYKVVFNVPPDEGALRAWLGEALSSAPDDALVVIDPAEVDRLSRTYGTPPLELKVPSSGMWTMRQIRQALAARGQADDRE
jgi:hypothetical protein